MEVPILPFKCESDTMPWKTCMQMYFHTLLAHVLIESFGVAVSVSKCKRSGQV